MVAPSAFDVCLERATLISPSVRHLGFRRVDGAPFDFAPGQWTNLLFTTPSGEEIKRSYSIASPPLGTPTFELAVTRVVGGPGSEALHDLGVGGTLRAIGPHGLFTRDPTEPSPSLFVATGTGIAPFRSMIGAALAANATVPLWLLFGGRTEADLIYRDEFCALAERHPNVRYEATLSRPDALWSGRSGYVQAHAPSFFEAFCAACSASAPPPRVYICGLDRMVSVVKDLFRNQLGVDRKRVHIERYD